MSRLLRVTKALQVDFKCKNCKQEYTKKWCKDDDATCFFCTNFLPMRDTYQTILKEIDWYFIKSGEYDRETYYPEFLDNLKKWANRFHVFPTKQDQKTEEELRDVKNWTREYWH